LSPLNALLKVGDALEMFVVLAKDSTSMQSLANVSGVHEVTAATDGERVFVVRRELKKD
jgi:20S proteasome subunit beta 6